MFEDILNYNATCLLPHSLEPLSEHATDVMRQGPGFFVTVIRLVDPREERKIILMNGSVTT
jgi:hypothetical protein